MENHNRSTTQKKNNLTFANTVGSVKGPNGTSLLQLAKLFFFNYQAKQSELAIAL